MFIHARTCLVYVIKNRCTLVYFSKDKRVIPILRSPSIFLTLVDVKASLALHPRNLLLHRHLTFVPLQRQRQNGRSGPTHPKVLIFWPPSQLNAQVDVCTGVSETSSSSVQKQYLAFSVRFWRHAVVIAFQYFLYIGSSIVRQYLISLSAMALKWGHCDANWATPSALWR